MKPTIWPLKDHPESKFFLEFQPPQPLSCNIKKNQDESKRIPGFPQKKCSWKTSKRVKWHKPLDLEYIQQNFLSCGYWFDIYIWCIISWNNIVMRKRIHAKCLDTYNFTACSNNISKTIQIGSKMCLWSTDMMWFWWACIVFTHRRITKLKSHHQYHRFVIYRSRILLLLSPIKVNVWSMSSSEILKTRHFKKKLFGLIPMSISNITESRKKIGKTA